MIHKTSLAECTPFLHMMEWSRNGNDPTCSSGPATNDLHATDEDSIVQTWAAPLAHYNGLTYVSSLFRLPTPMPPTPNCRHTYCNPVHHQPGTAEWPRGSKLEGTYRLDGGTV